MTPRGRVEALFGEDEFDSWMGHLVRSALYISERAEQLLGSPLYLELRAQAIASAVSDT